MEPNPAHANGGPAGSEITTTGHNAREPQRLVGPAAHRLLARRAGKQIAEKLAETAESWPTFAEEGIYQQVLSLLEAGVHNFRGDPDDARQILRALIRHLVELGMSSDVIPGQLVEGPSGHRAGKPSQSDGRIALERRRRVAQSVNPTAVAFKHRAAVHSCA